ncbi:MAG: hemerythrin domain-containing protein [Gammaproteobacteria bacterium]|jgi:hypothetical protein
MYLDFIDLLEQEGEQIEKLVGDTRMRLQAANYTAAKSLYRQLSRRLHRYLTIERETVLPVLDMDQILEGRDTLKRLEQEHQRLEQVLLSLDVGMSAAQPDIGAMKPHLSSLTHLLDEYRVWESQVLFNQWRSAAAFNFTVANDLRRRIGQQLEAA